MDYERYILVVLAVSACSVTVTKTTVFVWLRRAVKRLGYYPGYLVRCPYCFSHWVAFAAVAAALPFRGPLFFLLDWLAVVALSALVSGLIVKSLLVMANLED